MLQFISEIRDKLKQVTPPEDSFEQVAASQIDELRAMELTARALIRFAERHAEKLEAMEG